MLRAFPTPKTMLDCRPEGLAFFRPPAKPFSRYIAHAMLLLRASPGNPESSPANVMFISLRPLNAELIGSRPFHAFARSKVDPDKRLRAYSALVDKERLPEWRFALRNAD